VLFGTQIPAPGWFFFWLHLHCFSRRTRSSSSQLKRLPAADGSLFFVLKRLPSPLTYAVPPPRVFPIGVEFSLQLSAATQPPPPPLETTFACTGLAFRPFQTHGHSPVTLLSLPPGLYFLSLSPPSGRFGTHAKCDLPWRAALPSNAFQI